MTEDEMETARKELHCYAECGDYLRRVSLYGARFALIGLADLWDGKYSTPDTHDAAAAIRDYVRNNYPEPEETK